MDGFRNEDDWPARYTIDFGKRLSREASSFRNTISGQLSQEGNKGPIIHQGLCLSEVREGSHEIFLAAISDLIGQKVDGIVLGCTEIGMLIQQSHTRNPILDSTALHAQALVEFVLNERAWLYANYGIP